MTETATPDADATPPPLTEKARDALRAVAEWCETQRQDAEATAGHQFRTIWWLLGAGLVLLLTLPLIIAYIDHYLGLEESLPPVVVQEATDAKALLEANQSEMQKEMVDATTVHVELLKQIAEREADLKTSEADLRAAITSPLAVWRRSAIVGLEGSATVRALLRAPDGTLIAAGGERVSGKEQVLLLRSTDGVDWTPVRPEAAGERLAGLITALIAAPDGTLIAAGLEGEFFQSKILLLRSTDGIDWTPVRLEVRLPGAISALTTAPDGTLIAAGWEDEGGRDSVLLLRSTDGVNWTPVRLEKAGQRLAGGIGALIAAPDGTLIAAGWEDESGEGKVLLLRSTDGVDWTPVRPEEAGKRLAGSIAGLTAAPDGTLFAAASEGKFIESKVLLLRSTDGVDWTPVRPEEAGDRLAGNIGALMTAPDGTLIAARGESESGKRRVLLRDSTRGPIMSGGIIGLIERVGLEIELASEPTLASEILLLRSTDGADWTSVRLEEEGEQQAGSIAALMAAPDGTLIAAGSGVGILKSVAATEMSGIADSLLDTGVAPPGLIVSAGAGQRLSDIVDRRAAIEVLRKQEAQQQAFLKTAEASLTRQFTAVETLGTVAVNLDKALRDAEPWRQASRTATRLAVIALLIFLVQIVVNRYRYLQRLAGFYQARAQAFRMLADTDPGLGAQLLKDVTATELIASLSPDAIRFDKTAAAPTDNLARLLQAGLRK